MARHSRDDREHETAELPLTVPEVPLDGPTLRGDYDPEPPQELKLEPLEDAVSRMFPVTDAEVARALHQHGFPESGPFSLKLGTDDYQPMYKGGPPDMDRKPEPEVFRAAGTEEFSGLVDAPLPPIEKKGSSGPLILALVGLTLGLVSTTLALWVWVHGCG